MLQCGSNNNKAKYWTMGIKCFAKLSHCKWLGVQFGGDWWSLVEIGGVWRRLVEFGRESLLVVATCNPCGLEDVGGEFARG